MVAYTSPDCIPYFECSDPVCLNTGSLCEPTSIWCDQARLVENRFAQFEQVISRTAETVPMVLLQRPEPFTHLVSNTTGTIVNFTQVVVDTNDMADLGAYPLGFTVRTSGIYEIMCYLIGTTDTTASDLSVSATFRTNAPFYVNNGFSIGTLSTNFVAGVVDSIVTLQIHMPLPLNTGQMTTLEIGTGGDAADRVNFSYAFMSASWLAELP